MPEEWEIDSDEGIGFFRDVWTIVDVPSSDAQLVIERERVLICAIDSLVTTPEDFDRLARCVEHWDPEEVDDEYVASSAERSLMVSAIGDADSAEVGGLELGVAGLVYALASVGMVPTASCRGHTGDRPWSDSPVVLFAACERDVRVLEPLVQEAGCVFDIDPSRAELLVVGAPSVRNLMSLAQAVLDAGDRFGDRSDGDSSTGGA